jgi:DNA-directed RNA polymerase subunit RPC12/RpoP
VDAARQANREGGGSATKPTAEARAHYDQETKHHEAADRHWRAAYRAKKVESAPAAGKDITEMTEQEVQKLVADQVAAALKARAKKDDEDGDEIECPECGAEIPIPDDDEDDEITCPECGYEVTIKAHKALKIARAKMADLCKQITAAIETRTEALRKDMGQVGRLADILQGIRWLQQASFWEGQTEQDSRDFALADRMGEWLQEGVNILNALVADETSELTTDLVVPALKAATNEEGDEAMNKEGIELLNKAAKGLKAHFGKAAGFHEQKAACHKAAGEKHDEMAEAHKEAGKEEGANKAFHKVGAAHHAFKAAHHEKLHKAHSAMAEHCKAAAEGLGNEEAKADTSSDMTKALGDQQVAIDAKFEALTKALAVLEKLDTMEKAIGALQVDVTKMGNETLPSLVKGAGAPKLIDRKGQALETDQILNSDSSKLFA